MKLNTLIVNGIKPKSNPHNSVTLPIFLSSTFIQDSISSSNKFSYSRSANPTRNAFEELFAKVEGVKYCFSTATGMAATTAVFNLFKFSDKILLSSQVYGGTYKYASTIFPAQGIKYELIDDFNELDESVITSDVKAIFIETPSNPLLRVTDIKRVVSMAHSKGALVIVDNTFLTPYYQRLFEFGVDIVIYSATKYIGGHSDLLAGLITTNNDEIAARLEVLKSTLGATLAPTDAYYLTRGLKTLSVRFDRQTANTHAIINALKNENGIERIYYPGSYSEHEKQLQNSQSSDIGAVISIELASGYDIHKFLNSLEVFNVAVSLGSVESLICHPYSMTHDSLSQSLRQKLGITQNLLRLAVGIEDSDDLINDLKQALRLAKIS